MIILARYEDEKEGGSGQIDAILADYVLSDVVNPALNAILTNRIKRNASFLYKISRCHVLNLMILCALNFFFKITDFSSNR